MFFVETTDQDNYQIDSVKYKQKTKLKSDFVIYRSLLRASAMNLTASK